MDQRKERRVCIRFCANVGKSATETATVIQQVFGTWVGETFLAGFSKSNLWLETRSISEDFILVNKYIKVFSVLFFGKNMPIAMNTCGSLCGF
jgi:hypothetical protein